MRTFINLRTVNVQGGEAKFKENLGRISTKIEGESNGSISIDAFKGQAETYERREDAEIQIYYGGKQAFEGTLTELVNKLKK